jgi:hypothetical protein
MAQKEIFSDKDKLLLLFFTITSILISILIGNFIATFFLFLISIVLISFIYSMIHVKSFNKELLIKMKETCYVLSFSFLSALIVAIILPYILFHNSFVNIFVIQYLYLLPILLVFFALLCLYSDIINNAKIDYKKIIRSSLIISCIVSVILTISLIIGINYIYNQNTQRYDRSFGENVLEVNVKTMELYKANYTIFTEIKEYQEKFINETKEQNDLLQKKDANKGLCVQTKCIKNALDKQYHILTSVLNSMIIQGTLKQADKELEYFNSSEFKQNFTSLEEYKVYLKNNINASNFTITSISDEDKATLNLLKSEFNYQDAQKLMNDNTVKTENAGLSSMFSLSGTGSIVETSLTYTMLHTTYFKELIRFVMKTKIYTMLQSENNDLFVRIYNNKDINESAESKIIRYRIIIDRIER